MYPTYRPQQDKHRRATNVVSQPARVNLAPKSRSMMTPNEFHLVPNYRDKYIVTGLRWMMKPRIPRDFLYYFPYGLEYLLHLNKIFVDYEQMTDTLFESIVKNEHGEKIYHALDDNRFCRQAISNNSLKRTQILDISHQEIICIETDLNNCACCWCACCSTFGNSIKVRSLTKTLGYIQQSASFWASHWNVYDSNKKEVFNIKGPNFLNKDANYFEIFSRNGQHIGEYFFQSSKHVIHNNPSPQNGIIFPADINVELKGILMGGFFLIDSMFFEKSLNTFKKSNFSDSQV